MKQTFDLFTRPGLSLSPNLQRQRNVQELEDRIEKMRHELEQMSKLAEALR